MSEILLSRDDITTLKVDAIVNAANSKLAGGGGVDGAIHRAAGPQLLSECQSLNGCATGSAKITNSYSLPCKYVIHAVGPVWRGGKKGEEELLKSCYSTAMKIAKDKNLKTIAFPNISTGIYGYPKEQAADIAVGEVKSFLKKEDLEITVIFVCFDTENYNLYNELLKDNS